MMGKARKHSRGFVPDYMPNEYGYNEIEDSPALKRSRYSMNGDSYGVSKEILSMSKMSRSDRKSLVHKLRIELEQVRDLRKKIANMSSDTVLLSPYSDIHSCSDGPKRLPQDNFTHGKNRRPGPGTKRVPPQQFRPAVVKGSTMASVMKECEKLLDRLWSHKKGWAFRTPVDPVLLNIPDYFTLIKHPMDLGTIRSRMQRQEYSSPLDFAADVRLTFANSMAYNPPANQYHIMARDVSMYFESRWKIIEKKIPVIEPPPPVMQLTSSSASLESEIPYKVEPPRKRAAVVNESVLRVEPAKLVMTDGEKKKLSRDLEEMEEEIPQSIIDLLREQIANDGQTGEVEIEIDIDTLSDEILFKVRRLVDDHLREKKKSLLKGEPCEMEIVHDSGFSNSPLQPSKGDMLIDEDVDIVGGNEPPVSSHPPLKIEKDAALSSSSSDSGSSSSDSDSCSSSGSETESIKASKRTSTEDKKEPGIGIHRKGDDTNSEKIVVNDSLKESSQVQPEVGEQSTAMDAVLADEGTALPDRQFVSEKRYRAAMLKNRFADTIMKAREKAKGEKGDPEKLRIEREEFEKRLKEEKLRLQAEARAAEEAVRKAEVEAAEKARREREQEREAARQAIQKMEKTVEINEGRRFMEDLEMLKGGEGDQLPTFMEEMSPKFSEDMLGSFKMEGNSNPLEQLGLFMRMDEDEDEDDEEDQPHLRQAEVDEQSADRKERDSLSPPGVEAEDKQYNENQEDEKPIQVKEGEEQIENDAVSPHIEEGEVYEEPVTEKAQETVNEEEEKLINQETQAVNVSASSSPMLEQENSVVDKGKGETEAVDMGEEDRLETEAVNMVDEEAEAVDNREEATEAVDMDEQKTEALDIEQVETETAKKEEIETVVVDKREQETEVVNIAEQETEIVDMEEVETVIVEREEVETAVADTKEQETEILEMGEQETETVNMGEEDAEVLDKVETETMEKGGQDTASLDMREQETEVVNEKEEDTEVLNKGGEETETVHETVVVDVREHETVVVDMREHETVVIGVRDHETVVIDVREEATEVVNMSEEGTKVLDKGEEETETVEKIEQETVVVDMGDGETETVDVVEEETKVLDMGEKETEVVGEEID